MSPKVRGRPGPLHEVSNSSLMPAVRLPSVEGLLTSGTCFDYRAGMSAAGAGQSSAPHDPTQTRAGSHQAWPEFSLDRPSEQARSGVRRATLRLGRDLKT
jgi:hypothetical protein